MESKSTITCSIWQIEFQKAQGYFILTFCLFWLLSVKIQIMFGLFRKKSEKEKLEEKYRKLMEESFHLSKSNRAAGDAKFAEAEAIMKQIEQLENK
jgi:hypothetical protein